MIKRLTNLYRRHFWSCEKFARHSGVKIGKDCNIQTRAFGTEPYLIEIGNHVQITDGVKFLTHGAGWILRNEMPNFDSFGRITIGSNVYIGNNSLLLQGVSIGNDVIVGAGSVVTKSVPEGWIVAGNPATKVGEAADFAARMRKHNFETKQSKNKKNDILAAPDSLFITKQNLQ